VADIPNFAVAADGPDGRRPRFSICTLVTRAAEYGEMVESFVAKGFVPEDCEYLYLDNATGNRFDAFAGYNLFLTRARGDFIILCHQDILLHADGRDALEDRLAELTVKDSHWGICGNAGGIALGQRAVRISDPHGANQRRGPFPVPTSALDENFLVVRREANLALSRDLHGFHFYGADLCIVADFLGWSAWVVDFHLYHKSGGPVDSAFFQMRQAVARKYRRAMRPRWIVTTVTDFFVSGSKAASRLLTSPAARVPRRAAILLRKFRRG
jgi:hypothetical protein